MKVSGIPASRSKNKVYELLLYKVHLPMESSKVVHTRNSDREGIAEQ